MRKLLWLAPLLLAGCHSAHVALKSQSAASAPLVTALPALPLDSALTATVVASRPAAFSQPALPPAAQASPSPWSRPVRGRALAPLAAVAKATSAAPVARQLAQHLRRPRPTEGVAESGLGRVALFFIGVVLAVLAGLAALVSLIPGVSFWGGLGLAAAGLVVLFLLYSLLSGGKKKK